MACHLLGAVIGFRPKQGIRQIGAMVATPYPPADPMLHDPCPGQHTHPTRGCLIQAASFFLSYRAKPKVFFTLHETGTNEAQPSGSAARFKDSDKPFSVSRRPIGGIKKEALINQAPSKKSGRCKSRQVTGPGVPQLGGENLSLTQSLPLFSYYHHIPNPYIVFRMANCNILDAAQGPSLVLLIAIQVCTKSALRFFKSSIDGIVHAFVRLGDHDSAVTWSIRPTFGHHFRKFLEPFGPPVLHQVFHLNTLLVGNGGNASGQLLQLAKTGRYNCKVHAQTLRSLGFPFKSSQGATGNSNNRAGSDFFHSAKPSEQPRIFLRHCSCFLR